MVFTADMNRRDVGEQTRNSGARLCDHVVEECEIVGCVKKLRRCSSPVAVLLPLCRIAMPQPQRSEVVAARRKLVNPPADSSDESSSESEDERPSRGKRNHLRSQAKAKEENERLKTARKKAKNDADQDFLKG